MLIDKSTCEYLLFPHFEYKVVKKVNLSIQISYLPRQIEQTFDKLQANVSPSYKVNNDYWFYHYFRTRRFSVKNII